MVTYFRMQNCAAGRPLLWSTLLLHQVRSTSLALLQKFLADLDRKGPVTPLFFAVNMLVNTGEGNTFSFDEISAWRKEAGIIHARLLDAPRPSPLILATKP